MSSAAREIGTYHQPPTAKESASLEAMRAEMAKGDFTLLEDDKAFHFDDMTLLRFLRNRDGKVEKAMKSLSECVAWRKEYKPHRITFDDVKDWAAHGVSICNGFTKIGTPIIHVRPVSDMKICFETRVKFVIWAMEELMRRGYYEVAFVGDFSAMESAPSKEDTKAREHLDEIRKKYYPLFESKLFMISMPLILRAIFAVMVSFMSDAQKATMHTGLKPKHLLEYIDEAELLERLGGKKKIIMKEGGEGVDYLAMFPPSRV